MEAQMKETQILLVAGLFALSMGCNALNPPQARTSVAPASPIVADTTNRSIPAGTDLPIRTDENIDSQKAGTQFKAQIAQEVVDQQGHVLIPAGSAAELEITQVSNGGKTGTKTMTLALRSLKVRGKTYAVKSSTDKERAQEGLGKNSRTATNVGGGALLGAAVGAAAGAGVGAVAGAAIGAGVGAGVEILTRGNKVRVPAETILLFRLNQQIVLARS